MKRELYASDGSYRAALNELSRRVAVGTKLKAVDSDSPGNKYLYCNLGLCAEDFGGVKDGVYWVPEKGHVCPHDRRYFGANGGELDRAYSDLERAQGCFHTCRIFKSKRPQDRGSISARVNAAIAKAAEVVS